MTIIITGKLATDITRLKGVTDERFDALACSRLLEESRPTRLAIRRIQLSLAEGAIRNAMDRAGMLVVGDHCSLTTPEFTLVVPRSRRISPVEGLHVRYVTHALSAESLMRVRPELGLGEETFITNPGLTWLLESMKATDVDSLKIAMEFCGTYSTAHGGSITYGLAPAIAPKDLVHQLDALVGAAEKNTDRRRRQEGAPCIRSRIHGLAAARRVAPFILGGSASPLETNVAITLALPAQRGGWGISGLTLNYRIDLSRQQREISDKRYIVVDGYVPQRRLAYECDSRMFHTQIEKGYRDRERASAALFHDIRLLHITSNIVMDEVRFTSFCEEFARLAGKRQRPCSDSTWDRRRSLRQQLGLPLNAPASYDTMTVPVEAYAEASAR